MKTRIISVNTNGIRAAARKGFFEWMIAQDADVVCIQETKAQRHQLDDEVFHPEGYHNAFFDAEKKGYSGVAIYAKQKPKKIITGFGLDIADSEGRYIQMDFENISVISIYLPSGTSGDERQAIKYQCLDRFLEHLKTLKRKRREFVICGDFNIVHKEQDIKNWKSNQKNSGCLPEERAWLDTLFDQENFVDAFREVDDRAHQYTWWSNRGQAWANNVGWRIDYHVTTPGLKDKVLRAEIYKDQRFSDHAPLIIDYAVNL